MLIRIYFLHTAVVLLTTFNIYNSVTFFNVNAKGDNFLLVFLLFRIIVRINRHYLAFFVVEKQYVFYEEGNKFSYNE